MAHQVTFEAYVEVIEKGIRGHAIFIPGDVIEELGIKGVTRLLGEVNEVPINLASLSSGDGRYYLYISKDLRRTAHIMLGVPVSVSISIDPDPKRVILPEEFEIALEQDPIAAKKFFAFTPGKQRSLAHYVNTAKREETRIKRSIELCEKIRTDNLYSQRKEREG